MKKTLTALCLAGFVVAIVGCGEPAKPAAKPAETKPAETKPADAKAGDTKPK